MLAACGGATSPPPTAVVPAASMVLVVPATTTHGWSVMTQEVVLPSLSKLIPEEASPGEDVEVEATDGIVKLVNDMGGVTGYLESVKSFSLFFEGKSIVSTACMIGRCEGTLNVPNDAQSGTHQISVEGSPSRSLTVTETPTVMPVVTSRPMSTTESNPTVSLTTISESDSPAD